MPDFRFHLKRQMYEIERKRAGYGSARILLTCRSIITAPDQNRRRKLQLRMQDFLFQNLAIA